MSTAPRVVLDTNIVLSALIFANSRMTGMRHAWQTDLCRALVSKATAAELIRVLAYPKFKLSAEEQQELLADYLPYCVTVRSASKPPTTPPCRDPFDVPFLQLAITGKADFLVTGDHDLLHLGHKFRCPIVSAEEFLNSLPNM